jgi:putative DNA primase/helicase
MELEDHHPDFLSTIQIPIEHDDHATCPLFKEFLLDIFEKDQERVNLIQELLGYCFVHEIKIQKAFIFVGPGSNGKSVLAEIIRNLIGAPNVSNVALSDLGGRFGLQNLPGKLVNISSENEFDKKFNTQNFKLVTGSDAVNVEQKYKDSFNTILFAKAIILLNRMMNTDDTTDAYYRRLQIIPFNKIYKELKANEAPKEGVAYMDKTLAERLLKELPGILNFALEGLTRLISNHFNLTESKACEQALKDYERTQNPVIEYFETRVRAVSGTKTLRPDFRKDFLNWASSNGYDEFRTIGATKFWDKFKKALIKNNITVREKKINGVMYVEDLQIEPTPIDNYVKPF